MKQNIGITQSWCQTRHELAEQFATAARLYGEAVASITQHPGKLSQSDYARLRTDVEKAQQRTEMMCCEFEEHVERHGCQIEHQPVTSLVESIEGVAQEPADEHRNGYQMRKPASLSEDKFKVDLWSHSAKCWTTRALKPRLT